MKIKIGLVALLTFAFIPLLAQQIVHAVPDVPRIPIDKNVIVGKLDNGLTYYIRRNTKPESKAELRLVVNAGSALERDDQQGVAHFLEHMAFNGTRNFPKNKLLDYLQKTGVRFGADLNATTSFDFTMYMLPIPTGDPVVLQNGYQVIRDWAGGLLLEPDEIEKERGVILEEKRMRQGANMRNIAKYYPVMTNNSIYSQRIPIGKEEVIKTAPRAAFTDYYRDWYRPNNMAVIVVGDINPEESLKTIKKLFGDLKNPANFPPRPEVLPIQWHQSDKAMVISDPENTNSTINVTIGLERSRPSSTWEDLAEDKILEVISGMFSGRLQEYSVDPKSPFGFSYINGRMGFFKGYQAASIYAQVKDNPTKALELMVAEVNRAKQYGFTQSELDRVIKNTLKFYEESLLEKDKTESASHTFEYMQHFLNGDPIPGIEAEQAFVKSLLEKLTLETVNAKVREFDLNKPSFILYNATEAMKTNITEDQLLSVYASAKLQPTTPYVERKVSSELLDKAPVPGKVTASSYNSQTDSKQYTLSNGIKVILKKTNFKNDEVVFRGSQWGGLTNLSTEEIVVSKYLSLAASMGVGAHKAVDMPKVLSGVEAGIFLNLSPYQLSMSGYASARDFEKFMQLFYLKMTRVNFDPSEFEGIKNNFSSQIGGLLKNPSFRFSDTLNKFRFNNSKRVSGFPVSAELSALSAEALRTLYQKITGNLRGAVLVFSGNIDEADFTSYLEKYVASIPTLASAVQINMANKVSPISGTNELRIRGGKENKSEINYSLYNDLAEISEKEILAFGLMTEILQIKVTEKLREEMGSTYSPLVNPMVVRPPVGGFNLSLSVSSLPENSSKIIMAYDGLIKAIINGEVAEGDLQKAKAQRSKVYETQVKTNNFWVFVLDQQAQYGYDVNVITDQLQRIQAIQLADIIAVAKKVLPGSHVLKGIMDPE